MRIYYRFLFLFHITAILIQSYVLLVVLNRMTIIWWQVGLTCLFIVWSVLFAMVAYARIRELENE